MVNISTHNNRASSSPWRFSLRVVIITNLVVCFLTAWYNSSDENNNSDVDVLRQLSSSSDPIYNLIPPEGPAKALPSTKRHNNHGGSSVTDLDIEQGLSPAAWHWMMSYIGIHSLLDVGCYGRGISASWFYFHGVSVQCVDDGSHYAYQNDAYQKTEDYHQKRLLLPKKEQQLIQHDFSRGPWWPEQTVDAVWCVDFLEHVGRNFQKNYIPTFRKAALIFATYSNLEGPHHVEVHDEEWWIHRMEMFGFVFSKDLTNSMKSVAKREAQRTILSFTTADSDRNANNTAPNGMPWIGLQILQHVMVFINPAVASLPQHANHLLSEPGCYDPRQKKPRECGQGEDGIEGEQVKLESVLPDRYRALPTNPQQHVDWYEYVKARVKDRSEEGKQRIQELIKEREKWKKKNQAEKEKQ